jgi:hypothetical protein
MTFSNGKPRKAQTNTPLVQSLAGNLVLGFLDRSGICRWGVASSTNGVQYNIWQYSFLQLRYMKHRVQLAARCQLEVVGELSNLTLRCTWICESLILIAAGNTQGY